MKIRILCLGAAFLAMACSVQAEVVTLDFTNTTDGNNADTYTYDDWDLFGDGSVTVDITVDVVTSGTLDKIDHGWGSNDGGSGRLDTGESISFSFSGLQGSVASYVTGFEFVGLVSSVQDGTIVWHQDADDEIEVNGVALTTYDEAQTSVTGMAYTAIAPYDLEDDFVTGGDDTSALTIAVDGAFTLAQIADSGRISGFQMDVVVGGPSVMEISIDFGETAPTTANWNQFTSSGSSATVSNLVRRSDGGVTDVGITVSGIDDDNGLNHLQGSGSSDASIYVDHIYGNGSDDDTLMFTIFGLNDSLTYDLSGGFYRDSSAFENIWTVGSDVRTNAYDGSVVDGYETFSGLSPSGGEITFSITDLVSGDIASIAELTIAYAVTGNVPPTAIAQSVSTLPETPLDLPLSGSDWEGSNLTYSIESQPTHGALATNGALPDLIYTPANGYTGSDSFMFSVSDGETNSAPATISIAVTNELPFAYAQSVRAVPDTPVDITLVGSNTEGPSNLTYTVFDSPTYGTLSGTAPDLTYEPTGGYIGDDSFTFSVNDGLAVSDPATVSITVASNGPNFIIFFTDDHGYNDLGCFGSPHIQTPRIDQMASEGIRFTDGYVASPVCGPSRAGLLTGSYPIRIGEHENKKFHHTEPHGDEIMIPELLRTAGYTSALIGKWHNSGEGTQDTSFEADRGPIDQGFDYFYGTPSHNGTRAVDTGTNVKTSILRADASGTTVADADLTQADADQMIYNYTQESMDFMTEAHHANQPFFLWLAHNMPHVSLGARQEFRDSAAARGLDVYTAVIEELDWSLGAVLDKLDELGIADNTFVIFTADNGPWTQDTLEGYYGSAFPLRGSKMRPLEGGPRVPYIVRWPGTIPTNTVSEEIVTTMDLFPTFMDYADVEMPEGLEIDGKSIRPLIEGTDTVSPHDYYYYYCYTYLFAIRDAQWKLVLPRRNAPYGMSWWAKWIDRVDEVQLYDLDNDPEETTNVAALYPEVVKRFMDQVEVARAELGDKDRIGSGARFHADPLTRRPDVAAYINNAPDPYVEDPIAGVVSAVKTSRDTAWVSFDDSEAYTSVELVWAYADQGQAEATVWEAAEGGGSASLGAKSSGSVVETELTGLNPFRQYIYRFILTGADGARWSIPAPINPEASPDIAYEIGIDFSDGGSTAGSGSEPGWNIINGDGTSSTVYDLRTSNTLAGVAIQATGITGGEMADDDIGFGHADYGNYLDTPFSDLSANDGVWSSGSIQIALSGLDDSLCYDVQVISMPAASTVLTDLTIEAGGVSLVRTYASFRPYINKDPDPFTNSDDVLVSPFYSRPTLVPAVFETLSTDGSGNLTITFSDDASIPVSAIHITARPITLLSKVESGSEFKVWADPVPENKTFQIGSTTNLTEGFAPMAPAQEVDTSTTQPVVLPMDPAETARFYRIQE